MSATLASVENIYSSLVENLENLRLAAKYAGKTCLASKGTRLDLLDRQLELVSALMQKLEIIDNLNYQIKYEVKASLLDTSDLTKRCNKARKNIESALDLAYSYFTQIATILGPEEFDLADKIVEELRPIVSKRCTGFTTHKLVSTVGNQQRFTYYICFENLRDSQGYVHPEYCLVLTFLAGKTYLTSLSSFCLPGQFKEGFPVDLSMQALINLLANDRIKLYALSSCRKTPTF